MDPLRDEAHVLASIEYDESFHVERTLASGPGGTTDLVTEAGRGPFVRKRVRDEVCNGAVWEALAQVDSSRVPHVLATYDLPGEHVAILEYLPGTPLDQVVAAHGRLPVATAVGIACDVCAAASALHERGIVHRDISPGNVVVGSDGACLIDCGIARMHDEGATHDTTLLGTWGYAAPEQYGFAQTDARSDVYSIGRLLEYMLTGLAPDADGFASAAARTRSDLPRIREVLDHACSFEPSARYQSAGELASALRAATGKATPPAPRVAGQGRRALAWTWLLGWGTIAVLQLAATVQLYLQPEHTTDRAASPIGLMLAAYLAYAIGYEGFGLLAYRGRYAEAEHPWREFGLRALLAFAVMAFVMVVYVCVASSIVGPSQPL